MSAAHSVGVLPGKPGGTPAATCVVALLCLWAVAQTSYATGPDVMRPGQTVSIDNPLALVRFALPALSGAVLLDIGCGEGNLAQALATEGAVVSGLDPDPDALESARLRAPTCRFDHGVAESLPYGDESFDAALFVNSLHHVPEARMHRALHEAWRVLRDGGSLVVIEPLASGSFFDALRPIEDETHIREAAQAALLMVAESDLFKRYRTIYYTRREIFKDIDAFFQRVVRVDPARRAVVAANRSSVEAAVLALATPLPTGEFTLDQPIKADILHVTKSRMR